MNLSPVALTLAILQPGLGSIQCVIVIPPLFCRRLSSMFSDSGSLSHLPYEPSEAPPPNPAARREEFLSPIGTVLYAPEFVTVKFFPDFSPLSIVAGRETCARFRFGCLVHQVTLGAVFCPRYELANRETRWDRRLLSHHPGRKRLNRIKNLCPKTSLCQTGDPANGQ